SDLILREVLDLTNVLDGRPAGSTGIPVNVGGTATDSSGNVPPGPGSMATVTLGSTNNAVTNGSDTVTGLITPWTSIPAIAGGDALFASIPGIDVFGSF